MFQTNSPELLQNAKALSFHDSTSLKGLIRRILLLLLPLLFLLSLDLVEKWFYVPRKLVSWCFEPSKPQRITSGLRTNFTLPPSHSFHKSSYTSHGLWALLYCAGTQHGNLHPAGWPILFFGPTKEPVLATANTGKTRERFWKKCRWMDRKGRNNQGRNPWQ